MSLELFTASHASILLSSPQHLVSLLLLAVLLYKLSEKPLVGHRRRWRAFLRHCEGKAEQEHCLRDCSSNGITLDAEARSQVSNKLDQSVQYLCVAQSRRLRLWRSLRKGLALEVVAINPWKQLRLLPGNPIKLLTNPTSSSPAWDSHSLPWGSFWLTEWGEGGTQQAQKRNCSSGKKLSKLSKAE